MNRLFETGKIGSYLDSITHKLETRKDHDVKITELTLRVQPFDAKLASAMSAEVRSELFKLNHPDPKPILKRVDFALGVPRQQLQVFAAPDTSKASIVIDQVKVSGIYARTSKDSQGYTLVLKASFGPCSKEELEYVNDWFLGQRFVTFLEAEPSLDLDAGDPDEDDETPAATRPAPMFETEADGRPLEAAATGEAQEPARQLPRRHADGPKRMARGVRKPTTH